MKPQIKKTIVHIKSALPIFGAAAVFLLFSLILPIYSLWAILVSAALAAAAYFALDKFVFTGRDEEVVEEILTGDKELDAQIKQSRAILERFRAAAETAGDENVSGYLTRIADSAEGIIDEVVHDSADRGDAYTFFSYYMPTLDKLLSYYTQFALSGKGENALKSKARIEDCLKMVAQAFEKFQDKLYRNEAVEIKASVDVMKLMLRTDGLTGNAASDEAEADRALADLSARLQNEADMEQATLTQSTH